MDDTNPKKVFGMAKPGMSNVPQIAMFFLGLAMQEGADKYGPFNWRKTKVDASTYYNAAMRHWNLYFSGEDYDPKTGLHHLGYAMACAAILIDADLTESLFDDRPFDAGELSLFLEKWTKPLPSE